jgi:putative redox protein
VDAFGEPVKVVARRRDGYAHEVEIEGRHRVLVDEPTEAGGADSGPSPTRLIAAGLASCVAITVEMYAARKGWALGDLEVEVEVEYERYVPSAFDIALRLPEGLDEAQRERLLKIAAKCPVRRILAEETAVSERLEAR